MSDIEKLEQRVAALEAEVAKWKDEQAEQQQKKKPWWEQICGTFANDPDYDEAMRLGRKYRESTGPKPKRKKKATR